MKIRQSSVLRRVFWVAILGALATRAAQRVSRVKPPEATAPGAAVWNPLDFSTPAAG